STGRRLTPSGESIDHLRRYAVKTLESKETRASKEIRVTHNSVFAAHRLQCRMTNRKKRHPAFCFVQKTESERQEACRAGCLARRSFLAKAGVGRKQLHSIFQSAKHVRRPAANDHRA